MDLPIRWLDATNPSQTCKISVDSLYRYISTREPEIAIVACTHSGIYDGRSLARSASKRARPSLRPRGWHSAPDIGLPA